MTRKLHDGREDGLTPLEPLDIENVSTFAGLLDGMANTAFGGRDLGEAFQVLRAMTEDPDCTIVLTISGAMTIAKMGRVICSMIECGAANLIVSTGALMAHGLTEAIGGVHYKYDPTMSDEELYEKGYNRVYDTLEMEENLSDAEVAVRGVFTNFDWSRPACSHRINAAIGESLVKQGQMPSILGMAYTKGVPVYVPAFTDSELGLDLATFALRSRPKPKGVEEFETFFAEPPSFNPFLDLYDFAKRMISSKTLGIFTVGGGVPRNWAQQISPFADIINMRLGTALPLPRIKYGVRLCPEPVHWGGLSGCTYSEGVSWGKFVPPEEGGRFAEVRCDATIAWPILMRALLEVQAKR